MAAAPTQKDGRAFIDERDLAQVRGEKDRKTRDALVHAVTTHRRMEKLRVGDVVPDIVVRELDGLRKFNLGLEGNRPLLIVLGSLSCPPFRRATDELRSLRLQFANLADFMLVYIEEAHPTGEWQPPSNLAEDVRINQHSSLEERQAAAQSYANDHKTEIPIAVDGMENTANHFFAAWPVRIYIIDAKGKVYFQGGRGPYDFKIDEARASLEELLEAGGA